MKGRGDRQFETIVIGGDQAGLAVGYHLAKKDPHFTIVVEHLASPLAGR
jgi:cation diffusion facilitator CzcD-associated flavoprotein CzcO